MLALEGTCNLLCCSYAFQVFFLFHTLKGSLWKLQIRKRVQIFKRIDICFCLHPLDTRTSRGRSDQVMVLNRWLCSSDIFLKVWPDSWLHDVVLWIFFNASNIFNHVIIVNLQTHFLWHIMEFPFLSAYLLSSVSCHPHFTCIILFLLILWLSTIF